MSKQHSLAELRQYPREWRRRGLTPPAALDAIVTARLNDTVGLAAPKPTYADFFAA